MIITEEQKKEIEQLIPEHKEALIAYGADMYCRGIVKEAVRIALGVGCCFIIDGSIRVYKHWKSKKEDEKES